VTRGKRSRGGRKWGLVGVREVGWLGGVRGGGENGEGGGVIGEVGGRCVVAGEGWDCMMSGYDVGGRAGIGVMGRMGGKWTCIVRMQGGS